jgi:hypothetical protein
MTQEPPWGGFCGIGRVMEWFVLATPIVAGITSFIGAGLAAFFALRRFYAEKVWERKTVAYTAIFQALYDMSLWDDAHITAQQRGREVEDAEQDKLIADYQDAKSRLKRSLAAEVWLIPDDCKARIDVMFRELNRRVDDWYESLEKDSAAISTAIRDLTLLVRADLNLQPAKWRSWFTSSPNSKSPG